MSDGRKDCKYSIGKRGEGEGVNSVSGMRPTMPFHGVLYDESLAVDKGGKDVRGGDEGSLI